ncbi:alpha/beta fold hydrolase [Hymenobacter sp. BT730]|uniref:alpha/beta fold hydrolase n=1 Tax=Hymenobacter sp. BT730 TaxID=3063332 RepID=UPI0026DFC601|nr:alpha/beta fold hydrolase [Hymenobacter sp. BT730]
MKTHLHYQRYGSGPRVILAFHGYGQGESYWRSLIDALGSGVTVYAFDLFYHGRSRLARPDAPLRKKRLGELLHDFLQEQQLTRFGLLAFSMGAKFALTVLENHPQQVEKIWLIAPDGLQRQFWYSLATSPAIMRGVLGRAVLRPQRLLGLLDTLAQRRLVSSGLVRFAQWQLDSREKRLRVYRSWTGFRHLTFDLAHLRRLLNTHQIPVTFFLGQHDQVIPYAGLQPFINGLEHAHTVVLNAGHGGLLYDVASWLRRHPAEASW